ncbi:myotubularin-like protein [Capsaspora owczarzaki ATCC 30864]|uniref:Myotubularin-like protein n=1 Tax=Capsaspora owczarzaki (strain ATCC 30864) TaxID=595528 RepID=A0A0D2USG3_CAPO3|nr:myotubularin-like protein [Capsaspora owczarzaki ATCC 30864]KJE97916.1 myotubularin-like protein [Capsaspora owczarzaki ATCC 30864]|eukprot:XP_004342587.2 myotubularin-like protein [Capsaspora owczarzaki ATCC 30864]
MPVDGPSCYTQPLTPLLAGEHLRISTRDVRSVFRAGARAAHLVTLFQAQSQSQNQSQSQSQTQSQTPSQAQQPQLQAQLQVPAESCASNGAPMATVTPTTPTTPATLITSATAAATTAGGAGAGALAIVACGTLLVTNYRLAFVLSSMAPNQPSLEALVPGLPTAAAAAGGSGSGGAVPAPGSSGAVVGGTASLASALVGSLMMSFHTGNNHAAADTAATGAGGRGSLPNANATVTAGGSKAARQYSSMDNLSQALARQDDDDVAPSNTESNGVLTEPADGRASASTAASLASSVNDLTGLDDIELDDAWFGANGVGFEIPLGLVSHAEKVGGHRNLRDSVYGLDVYCKDGTVLFLGFDLEGHVNYERRHVYDMLVSQAFPLSYNKPLFAFVHGAVSLHIPLTVDSNPAQSSQRNHSIQLQSLPPAASTSTVSVAGDYARLGIPNDYWQISDANRNHELVPSYPAQLVVPAGLSEDHLKDVAKFRTQGRLPILSWVHSTSGASITRCSQPKIGVLGKRSIVDESMLRLLAASNIERNNKLFVVDARPYKNVIANQAMGAGVEHTSVYQHVEIEFMNIENIHVMRECLKRLHRGSHVEWLQHVSQVLKGALRIVHIILAERASVLIHCSDGWDRTPQLSALAQLCLDPYYRTIVGFECLIQKEWLSMGHKFAQRLGHGTKNHSDEQRSPIFIQFLDCVWQLCNQFPSAFEFNARFLITVANEAYTCRFGTFLFNNDFERRQADLASRTLSLWDYIDNAKGLYQNIAYSPPSQPVLYYDASPLRMLVWNDFYFQGVRRARRNDWTLSTLVFANGDASSARNSQSAHRDREPSANDASESQAEPSSVARNTVVHLLQPQPHAPLVPGAAAASSSGDGIPPSPAKTIVNSSVLASGSSGVTIPGLGQPSRNAVTASEGIASLSRTGVVIEGYLTKQGGNFKTWKKRWFVLDSATLQLRYYKEPTPVASSIQKANLQPSSSNLPLGVIDIANCDDIQHEDGGRSSDAHAFRIVTPNRTYFVRADNQVFANLWVDKLQEARTMAHQIRASTTGS